MSIRLENVSHIYDSNSDEKSVALNNANLVINEGEFIGIVGHTGSGKSTLIQHLNGLMLPTSGTVYYDDEDISRDGYDLRGLRGKVGMCFQYPEHQLFEVTILDDVAFGPMNYGISKEEAVKTAKSCLYAVGMREELYGKSPFELSGGQKRRVAIAGILAMHPKYLVLDEPTAGLDPEGREHILKLLRTLNEERHMTIILVSHSMEDMATYVDRLIVMNHGNVEFDGTKEEVFSHKKELEAMGLSVPFFRYVVEDLKERGMNIDTSALTLEEAKTAILDAIKRKENHD
ncbi:MAG: energy-coupling factor transporter ATPase [Anaerostipes sp.]|nr:energy-coupling factor transporter ATPase [Anaerostipes sp.]